MILLEYETRLQQPRTAILATDYADEAWKRRAIDDDLITAKGARNATTRRFDWRTP